MENKLHNVHTDIMKLGKEIIKTTSERPVEKTPVLKKSVMIAVEDLLKELEVAHVKNKDLDYKPLYDELNRLSTNYRNDVSRRVLHNMQKAEKKKEVTTNMPDKSVLKSNFSQGAHPFAQRTLLLDRKELSKIKIKDKIEIEKVKDNDTRCDIKSLKQEKTVAASTKYQQLPPVNDGGLNMSTS